MNTERRNAGRIAFEAFGGSSDDEQWSLHPHHDQWHRVAQAVIDWYESDDYPGERPPLPDEHEPDEKEPKTPPQFPCEEYSTVLEARVRVEHDRDILGVSLFLYGPADDRGVTGGFGLSLDLPCAQAVARDILARVRWLAGGQEVAVLLGEHEKAAGGPKKQTS